MLLVFSALLSLLSASSACDLKLNSFKETGIACRLTKPATLVLNEQTVQVIQAAFRHATYPDINGQQTMKVLGKVTYGLNNIQINDLTIDKSEVGLKEDDAVKIMIQNVSASFKGTLHYGYGGWLVNIARNIDFEIESSTDLEINTKLTCRNNRVAADTSDCYLTFHRLALHLHGDKQPGLIKLLFTNFISFTLKLVLKSQICKEINYLANILADFIQDRAENVLHDDDIAVDLSVTSLPIIKENYIESYHKGLLLYKNHTVVFNDTTFAPSLLTDSKMLYFWFSEEVLSALVMAAFLDKRFTMNVTGEELKEMLETEALKAHHGILQEIFCGSLAENSLLQVWGLNPPQVTLTLQGTVVKSSAAVELSILSRQEGPSVALYFETEVTSTVRASYVEKKLILHPSSTIIYTNDIKSASKISANEESVRRFLQTAITAVGIPAVISRLELALTRLMNSKGLNLFELTDPEIITKEGYLIIQLDFGFPRHLLVDFLKIAL